MKLLNFGCSRRWEPLNRILGRDVWRDYSNCQDLAQWNIYRLQYPNIVFDAQIKIWNFLVLIDFHMGRLYHWKQTVTPSLVVFSHLLRFVLQKTPKKPCIDLPRCLCGHFWNMFIKLLSNPNTFMDVFDLCLCVCVWRVGGGGGG